LFQGVGEDKRMKNDKKIPNGIWRWRGM